MPSAQLSIRRETKTSQSLANGARDAIAMTFEALGGTDGLIEWAKRNPDKFYLFLWPRLMPKEFKVSAEVNSSGAVFHAVHVNDVNAALNTLERMRDAADAHSGRGGEGDGEAVAGVIQAHEACLPEADGGGAGGEQADDPADAAETREDDGVLAGPAVSLPDPVPLA